MKVAMISHGYAPRIGGAERQLGAVAPVLKEKGIDVSVLTRQLPGTEPYEVIDGVPVYRLPVPGFKALASLAFTFFGLKTLRKINPDIIHAHELISPSTTALLAHYLFKKPIVLNPHSSGPFGDVQKMNHKFLGQWRLKQFCQEAAAFIAISGEIDAELAGLGVPRSRRLQISNGIDSRRFKKLDDAERLECRRKLGLPADSRIAVFVGRLVPIKRIDILLAAWKNVNRIDPQALLLLIGSGPLEDELKKDAPAGVLFCGSHEDVAPYLQASDLFILTSDSEGIPVSLLEAMSCELPCLATAVGGIPDVITHEKSGWLVPAGDVEAVQLAVQLLFNDPALRLALGKHARETILEKYTVDTMALRLKSLYETLISNRGTP